MQGNQVLIGGQPDSIAGPSLFWSNTGWNAERFYNAELVAYVKEQWDARLIRAAMGVDPTVAGFGGAPEPSGGYLDNTTPGNGEFQKSMVTTVVDAAIANDMYVIIDWHTHHAEDFTEEAVAFFSEMSARYGDFNNVIYEIYNEPLRVSWSGVIKPYAERVISAIRANDPDNLIIVGTPNWSQDVDVASQDPITGWNNIAYTLHFYANTHYAWKPAEEGGLIPKAQTALNNGIALFVTEWGSVEASGDGGVNYDSTNQWMDFLRSNNISHANWALNDKVEGASALTPGASATGGWNDGNLTESGRQVRDLIKGW